MTPDVLAAAIEGVTRTSTSEAVLFWILGAVIVGSAIGVVAAPKAVYSAIFLAITMINLAVLYFAQDAVFLGVVQVVVYTGAVMMLFLFVLMLVGVDTSDSLVETIRGQRMSAIVVGIGFGVLLIGAIGNASVGPFVGLTRSSGQSASSLATPNGAGNVEGLAVLIFTRYVWAFELTSALLITATLGAMVLAHRERFDRRKTQREMAAERFAPGGHPTPMPNPGVYARHNAVDVPARLPDGTGARTSVSSVLVPRGRVTQTDNRQSDNNVEGGTE